MSKKSAAAQKEIENFMKGLRQRNPHEPEFHQAVEEVVESVMPYVLDHDDIRHARVLERLTEPDRIVIFRVAWEDDDGNVRVDRAWRVQFNNSIGPYKGGLRFHPTVNLSVLKFLGFEQVLKNSLTGLPMGGAKGGANFNPKGKSNREIMRFCHSLMVELHRHIGEDTDVPAGDIGVGHREISYLFGMYKRMENRFAGILTGKGLAFGGSLVRKEATGYGNVYFMKNMLKKQDEGLKDKVCAVSGSGNVAIYTVEKLLQEGAKVVTMSDSSGFVHDKDGIDQEKLDWIKELKEVRYGRISEYADQFDGVDYHEDQKPWGVAVDLAFPSATQNELDGDDAKTLLDNGLQGVSEGANMPCSRDAVARFHDAKILFGPGKAANAGGVAVSGLEQSQNALRISWSRAQVDRRLQGIMKDIHEHCVDHGNDGNGWVDYVKGANLAGFVKVANAMMAYGVV